MRRGRIHADADAGPREPARLADFARPVWVVAGAHLLILLVVADRYGYHRDELYFLEAAQHLAFGYVDQPPLAPVLARLQTVLLGTTVSSIRLVPALASTATVVAAALLAREFGGQRRAQVIAAAALASAPFVLTHGHLLSTAGPDFLFWLVGIWVIARMLRTSEPRWWLAFGALAGLALWNKYLIGLLAIAVVVALAVSRCRDLLATRWLPLGGLLGAALAAPILWWQAANGWPQLEMVDALSDRLGAENRLTLLPLQLLLIGPPLIPLGLAGVRWMTRPNSRSRVLLSAYLIALVLTFVAGGRPYYPLALGSTVVIAGAVALERTGGRGLFPLVALNAAIALPLSLPLLPVDVLARTPIGEINDTQAESIGWPELVGEVTEVVRTLPETERASAVILTGSYGEAGALDRYGSGAGLPQAYSGHNSYWHWRRPADVDATVVAVRLPGSFLDQYFADCSLAATVDNGVGVDNEVQGQPIWVCRGLLETWEQVWLDFRHYN